MSNSKLKERKNYDIINKETKINVKTDIRNICFSKGLRRMADKTQMFSTSFGDHFRTRLTHTIEVAQISNMLATKLNLILQGNVMDSCNIDLVEAIAYAHDIGHTPFGHVGEETINKLLFEHPISKKIPVFFKHNANSFRILIKESEENSKNEYYDWRILDGVLKHTKVLPRDSIYNEFVKKLEPNEVKELLKDPYKLRTEFDDFPVFKDKTFTYAFSSFFDEFNERFYNANVPFKTNKEVYKKQVAKYFYYPFPLSLEGQIVRISDEISQRISDMDDTLRLIKKRKIESINTSKTLEQLVNPINDLINRIVTFINENLSITISKDDEKSHNNTKEYCDTLIKKLNAFSEIIKKDIKTVEMTDFDNIQLDIRRLTTDFLIDEVVDNLYKFLQNKSNLMKDNGELCLPSNKITIKNENSQITGYYYLYHPIKIGKKQTCLIFFSDLSDELDKLLSEFNVEKVIKEEEIKHSNSIGINIINELFEIYLAQPVYLHEKIKNNIFIELNKLYKRKKNDLFIEYMEKDSNFKLKKPKEKIEFMITENTKKNYINEVKKLLHIMNFSDKESYKNFYLEYPMTFYHILKEDIFVSNPKNAKYVTLIYDFAKIFLKLVLYNIASMTNNFAEKTLNELKIHISLSNKYHFNYENLKK